jgi:Ran GTPase-activating protein (RanGAP) involved in mRNA processing and transport
MDQVRNNNPQLHIVKFNNISDLEADKLGNALKTNTELINLTIDNSGKITVKGFKALLIGLSYNKHVKNLTVRGLNEKIFVSLECQEAFQEFLNKNSTITYFNFGSNNIDSKGGEAIARAFFETKVSGIYLSLSDNIISDIDAFVYVLKESSVFSFLSLGNNLITNDGAKALAEALIVNNSLEVLSLYKTKITDEGAIALSKVLKVNVTLKELNLKRCTFENKQSVIRALAIAIVLRSPAIISVDIVTQDQVLRERTRMIDENFRAALVALSRSRLTPGSFINTMNSDVYKILRRMLFETKDDEKWLIPSLPQNRRDDGKRQRSNACIGCLIGEPLFHEQHDPTRRFCSAYCQLIHHYRLPDVRGMTPAQIKQALKA